LIDFNPVFFKVNMKTLIVKKAKKVNGEIKAPGDKSVSHRSVMIGSIAQGKTAVKNFLKGDDCLRTMEAFKEMGVDIKEEKNGLLVIEGKGLCGLKKPSKPLYLGNSGTSMRLIMGILAGQDFEAVLTGDDSLSKRPMKRVTEPLRLMGANITGKDDANFAPITIKGGKLTSINYRLPVSSAQVKSALILAGLYADDVTRIYEPAKSRDHTERMLKLFGAKLDVEGVCVKVHPGQDFFGKDIFVPGDISSAAFFIAAGVLVKGSKLLIKDVGLNPTRTGIIEILIKMGADIKIANLKNEEFEPYGDLIVKSGSLKACKIEGDLVPKAIDEFPILMVLSCFAKGVTEIKGVSELRVKETDRINSMVTNLTKMGAKIRVELDDIYIEGVDKLKAARVDSFKDHRTAMALAIAGLTCDGETVIEDTECIETSFPSFEEDLKRIVTP